MDRVGLRAELGSADFAGDPMGEGVRRARSFLLRALGSRPRDAIGMGLAIGGAAAVMINALYLQPGPHPAPIFTIKPRPVSVASATGAVRVPRPRSGDVAKSDSSRSQAETSALRMLPCDGAASFITSAAGSPPG